MPEQDDIKLNLEDSDGQTALSRAASCGHSKLIKLLEQDDVELNLPDEFGLTPLINAAVHGHIYRDSETASEQRQHRHQF